MLSTCAVVSQKHYRAHSGTPVLTCASPRHAGSLRKLARTGYTSYTEEPRDEWVLHQPAQLVIAVSQIFWCTGVEDRLRSPDPTAGLQHYLQVCGTVHVVD